MATVVKILMVFPVLRQVGNYICHPSLVFYYCPIKILLRSLFSQRRKERQEKTITSLRALRLCENNYSFSFFKLITVFLYVTYSYYTHTQFFTGQQ